MYNRNIRPEPVRCAVLIATLLSLPLGTSVATASPLTLPNPLKICAGPLGQLDVQGVVSGMGFYQDNPQGAAGTIGGKRVGAEVTNGMVIVQKEGGPIQFYLQAGAYSFPTLAEPFTSPTSPVPNDFNAFGALPIGYLKIAPSANYSIEIGQLPTLIGAESGFTYQNINIERGLLWDMEPIISRGIQLNGTAGPLSASVSLNDGYFSNRYNVMSGSLSYTINSANTLGVYAEGPLGKSRQSVNPNDVAYSSYGNESQIYGIDYTYSSGPWMIEPYFQYMHTPYSSSLGVDHTFDNYGGAVLADYSFTNHVSLGARVEYLAVTGKPGEGLNSTGVAAGLTGFPADSHAWSITVTPTYQSGAFFARAELSYVAASTPTGYGLASSIGSIGTPTNQVRGLVETGFMF